MFPGSGLSQAGHFEDVGERGQEGAQELLEPAQEKAEVVAGGGD
jgi:hypothetical protein